MCAFTVTHIDREKLTFSILFFNYQLTSVHSYKTDKSENVFYKFNFQGPTAELEVLPFNEPFA